MGAGRSQFAAPFSESQLKAAAIVPKFASFPSILGSIFIVQHVLRSKKRRGRVYHRIMMGMSAMDFIYSVKSFLSTWPIPKDTMFVYGAVGTTQTCTAAGFLGQGGSLTSIFYNGSLTVFFLLVVRYGWKEEFIKQKVEIWLHAIPFAFGWFTAIAGLPLTLYNAFGWTCWINVYPFGCIDNETCQRGDNAAIYRWAFFHAELWLIFGFTMVAMILMYQTILGHEKKMEKYDFRKTAVQSPPVEGENTTATATAAPIAVDPSASTRTTGIIQHQLKLEQSRKRSTKFAVQATFYVVIFFFTWFFPMLQTAFSVRGNTIYFPLVLMSSILSSMQGFSNAVIYLRPRWIRYRNEHPNLSRWQALLSALRLHDPDASDGVASSGSVALRRRFFNRSNLERTSQKSDQNNNNNNNNNISAVEMEHNHVSKLTHVDVEKVIEESVLTDRSSGNGNEREQALGGNVEGGDEEDDDDEYLD